jgi:hypothetical protein
MGFILENNDLQRQVDTKKQFIFTASPHSVGYLVLSTVFQKLMDKSTTE